jgi:hypothetical protein
MAVFLKQAFTTLHTPALHSPLAQVFPQVPQFFTSVFRSTHPP